MNFRIHLPDSLVWPADLESWMKNPVPETGNPGPDFDAIRAEMNASMRSRSLPPPSNINSRS